MANSKDDFKVQARVLRSLRKRNGTVTAGDVAADTGLDYERVEAALQSMLRSYKSHLDVDTEGNLLYRFDPGLRRRGEDRRWMLYRLQSWAWKAFKAFFKVWIMVMLVGYTAAFLIMLLALAVGALAGGRSGDDRRGGLSAAPLYLFARVLEMLFWINLVNGRYSYGYGYEPPPRQRKRRRPDKPFYQRVFQFVFGPEQPQDKLAAERAFAHFVRTRGGRVTPAEWASRTGLSLRDAEDAMTAGLVRFRGQLDLSDAGSVVYRFDQLQTTAQQALMERDLPPVWQRDVHPPPLTGNTSSTNAWIGAFNTFNLIMSLMVVSGVLVLPAAWVIGLGYIPLAFSGLFFLVPLIRWVQHKRAESKAARRAERHRILKTVFEAARRGDVVPLEQIPQAHAGRIVEEFEGTIELLDDGRAVVSFARLGDQLRAADQARLQAPAHATVGAHGVFLGPDEDAARAARA